MLELTDLDKKLLNLLQGKLQLVSRPFKLIGEEVGMSEEQVITRLQLLKEAGYIRKIGAFFNSDELGYRGTLVALKVREGLMEETALFINQFPGITHNYQREGEYNLWFTLITPNERLRQDILGQIGARLDADVNALLAVGLGGDLNVLRGLPRLAAAVLADVESSHGLAGEIGDLFQQLGVNFCDHSLTSFLSSTGQLPSVSARIRGNISSVVPRWAMAPPDTTIISSASWMMRS